MIFDFRPTHEGADRIQKSACGVQDWREFGNGVSGVLTPVLAKHSKSLSPIDCISVGVDRMQHTFEPMRKQVEAWQRSELTNARGKGSDLRALIDGRLEAPKHLARTAHDLYFGQKYEELRRRTI